MTQVFELNYIERIILNYFNLKENQIRKYSRKANIVEARQCFFFLASKHTNLSLTTIGDFYEKDHATVIHSVKKITNEIELYEKTKNRINELTEILTNPLAPISVDLLQMSINYTNSFVKNF